MVSICTNLPANRARTPPGLVGRPGHRRRRAPRTPRTAGGRRLRPGCSLLALGPPAVLGRPGRIAASAGCTLRRSPRRARTVRPPERPGGLRPAHTTTGIRRATGRDPERPPTLRTTFGLPRLRRTGSLRRTIGRLPRDASPRRAGHPARRFQPDGEHATVDPDPAGLLTRSGPPVARPVDPGPAIPRPAGYFRPGRRARTHPVAGSWGRYSATDRVVAAPIARAADRTGCAQRRPGRSADPWSAAGHSGAARLAARWAADRPARTR